MSKMGMKVYILIRNTPGGDAIMGVFQTEETAERDKLEWNENAGLMDQAFVSLHEVNDE